MNVSSFRRQLIEQIVAETGNALCHYCKIECRLSFSSEYKNSATVDHKIPKSKGGTNDRENLVLACNECNNAKGDRSYEDFIARPYRVQSVNSRGRRLTPLERKKRSPVIAPAKKQKSAEKVHPAYKARKGTLAAAINSGEVDPSGTYRRARCDMGEPRNRIEPVPYHETMWILTGKKVRKRDLLEQRCK